MLEHMLSLWPGGEGMKALDLFEEIFRQDTWGVSGAIKGAKGDL